MFVCVLIVARHTAARGDLSFTHLDATGSQRNQFRELDGEGGHVVVVAAQRACFDLNATFPLGTRCPEAECVSRKPSTRNVKVSKERTGFVTACMGKVVVVLVERSRSLNGWLAGWPSASWKLGLRRHPLVPSAARTGAAEAVIFTSDACTRCFLVWV